MRASPQCCILRAQISAGLVRQPFAKPCSDLAGKQNSLEVSESGDLIGYLTASCHRLSA